VVRFIILEPECQCQLVTSRFSVLGALKLAVGIAFSGSGVGMIPTVLRVVFDGVAGK
jgi:hypothetical protein